MSQNQRFASIFFLYALSLAIFISPALAQSYPNPVGYVNDFANVLNESQKTFLELLLLQLEKNTTAQVAVVTVDSVSDIFNYAVGLFRAWGIGSSTNDNGVLMLYAKEQNRIQVITGYGVEGILPDAKVGRMLDEYYVPMRNVNRTAEGIVAATLAIADVIYQNADEVRAGSAGDYSSLIFMAIASFIMLAIIIILVAYTVTRRLVPKCPVDKIPMKKIKVHHMKNGIIGYITVTTYKCPKCGRIVRKKASGSHVVFFPVIIGGGGGGGFGGFGGGGTGGGGAGR